MGNVTFLKDAPQIHLHFMTDDELADSQGYAVTEICCHACGFSKIILFNLPKVGEETYGSDGDPALVKIQDEFKSQHLNCKPEPLPQFMEILDSGNDRFKMLCPPFRLSKNPERIDIRHDKPEDRMI